MPNKLQELKWYQPSTRDWFMTAGFIFGWIALLMIEWHVYPRPPYLDCLPLLTLVAGAGIGELVKRRRDLA